MNKKIIRVRDKPVTANPDIRHITSFFLTIYKHRLKALSLAPVKCERAEENCYGTSFKLSVMHNGNWASRKMTIGPVGEKGASKSRCYRVIYGDHMVVKFPPRPIEDFEEYLGAIRQETEMASILSPIECVVPKVSVVLKHIISPEELPGILEKSSFDEEDIRKLSEYGIVKAPGRYFVTVMKDLSAADINFLLTKTSLSKQQIMSLKEAYEGQYIYLLKKNSEYQEYLKVNDRFVFFSNLSDHDFVNDAIKKLHDTRQVVEEEMSRSAGLLWELQAFVEKYSRKYADDPALASLKKDEIAEVHKRVKSLYEVFESEVVREASETGAGRIGTHQLEEWFLLLLAGKKDQRDDKGLPPEFRNRLDQLFERLALGKGKDGPYAETIRDYRQLLTEHAVQIHFNRYAKYMGGLIAGCMQLLVLLQDKVAHRDIKPANLVLVGNNQRFPEFLADPNQFSIGTIDFETSCDISQPSAIDQPMMAGTFGRTTVSSFYNNDVLRAFHKDLRHLFHMQDYFGMMAVVFETATGTRLFDAAKKVIPSAYREIRNVYINQPDESLRNVSLRESYIRQSELFWKVAAAEFRKRTQEKETVLTQLPLELSERVTDTLADELVNIKKQKKTALGACFDLIKNIKARSKVRVASIEEIEALIGKLQAKNDKAAAPQLKLLNEIRTLKLQLRDIVLAERVLNRKGQDEISAFELLQVVFTIVSMNMLIDRGDGIAGSNRGRPQQSGVESSTAVLIR